MLQATECLSDGGRSGLYLLEGKAPHCEAGLMLKPR